MLGSQKPESHPGNVPELLKDSLKMMLDDTGGSLMTRPAQKTVDLLGLYFGGGIHP